MPINEDVYVGGEAPELGDLIEIVDPQRAYSVLYGKGKTVIVNEISMDGTFLSHLAEEEVVYINGKREIYDYDSTYGNYPYRFKLISRGHKIPDRKWKGRTSKDDSI